MISHVSKIFHLISDRPRAHSHIKMTPAKPSIASLLSLPFEIRLKIYEVLLVPKVEQPLILFRDQATTAQQTWDIETAILRISRSIYNEAIRVLYGRNRFKIELPDKPVPRLPAAEATTLHGITFRNLMPPQSFQRLRHIEIITSAPALLGFAGDPTLFYHSLIRRRWTVTRRPPGLSRQFEYLVAVLSMVELLIILVGDTDGVALFGDKSLKLVKRMEWDGVDPVQQVRPGEEDLDAVESSNRKLRYLDQNLRHTAETEQKVRQLINGIKAFRKVTIWQNFWHTDEHNEMLEVETWHHTGKHNEMLQVDTRDQTDDWIELLNR